jgi:hypothetical protein
VRGQTAALVSYVRSHLVPSDLRCQAAEQALRAERSGARPPDAQDKERARHAGVAETSAGGADRAARPGGAEHCE